MDCIKLVQLFLRKMFLVASGLIRIQGEEHNYMNQGLDGLACFSLKSTYKSKLNQVKKK